MSGEWSSDYLVVDRLHVPGVCLVVIAHCPCFRSFGVLLWEIMTLGRAPYPGIENRELLEQIEEKGLKLSKPKPCPNVM